MADFADWAEAQAYVEAFTKNALGGTAHTCRVTASGKIGVRYMHYFGGKAFNSLLGKWSETDSNGA